MTNTSVSNEAGSLSARMQQRTRGLHAQAERSGFIRNLIRGSIEPHRYRLWLRSLWCLYDALERSLAEPTNTSLFAGLPLPALRRAPRLASDLQRLHGPRWEDLPVADAARRYVACLGAAAGGGGERLIAHVYVRYLGDLSGGRLLRGAVQRALQLPDETLTAYDFPEWPDPGAARAELRSWIDGAGRHLANADAVVEEAALAFTLAIALSEELAASGT